MDALSLSYTAIKEGITKGYYELTGVLPTGELVLALVGEVEKDFLVPLLDSGESNEIKLKVTKELMSIKGRPANEIMQIYHQYSGDRDERCRKNGLRFR